MMNSFKALSQVRKWYTYNVLLVSLVNAFLIAITLTLVIELFGAKGAMFKEYAAGLWPLLLLVPYLGGMTSINPRRSIRFAIIFEFLGLFGFILAAYNIYPAFAFCSALAIMFTSNVLMTPPRTQLGSIIINGEANFSIFIEKARSLSLALGSGAGLGIIYFKLDVMVNVIGMLVCLGLSRYYVVKTFDSVFSDKFDAETRQ